MSGGATGSGLVGGAGAPAPSGGSSGAGPAGGQTALAPDGGAGARGALAAGGITKPEADVWYVNAEGDTMTGLLTTPSGPLQPSAAAGNTLTWEPDGLYVPPPPERQTLQYRHATSTTMADPGPGYARSNGAGAAVTALAFDVLTDAGTDASPLLRAVQEGDGIYVQDKDDSAHWARFVAEGAPLDRSGWFEVPVAHLAGSGTDPGNNERLEVTFTLAPATGTGALDYAQLLVSATPPAAPVAPTDAFWFNPSETA